MCCIYSFSESVKKKHIQINIYQLYKGFKFLWAALSYRSDHLAGFRRIAEILRCHKLN